MGKPLVGFSNTPSAEAGVKLAKEAGAKVIRRKEGGSLKTYTEQCEKFSLKLIWTAFVGEGPSEGKLKTTIEQINALTSGQKATIALVEFMNEPYEEGSADKTNGKAYGEKFITAAAEWKAKGMTIPLGMVGRVSSSIGSGSGLTESWMTKLGEVKHSELKTALIGNGTESAPQHKLVSHPYGPGLPSVKLKFRNSLSTTSAKESSENTSGEPNSAQRWIHEQAIVANWTGITNLETALTEYGAPEGSPGSKAVKEREIKELFLMAHKAWKNELSENAPEGYGNPLMFACCWFQAQEEFKTPENGFGIFTDSLSGEIAPYGKLFKTAMETFATEEPASVKFKASIAATSSLTAKFKSGTVTKLIGSSETGNKVGENERSGGEAAFQFTCEKTGTLTELEFYTSFEGKAHPNTNITKLFLGIAAENAGRPGTILAQGKVEGTAPEIGWIKVPLESTTKITLGQKYWLIMLPIGTGEEPRFHFDFAVEAGGTLNTESSKSTFTKIEATTEWELPPRSRGPVSFVGLGGESAGASFAAQINASGGLTAVFTSPRFSAQINAVSGLRAVFRTSKAPVTESFAQRYIDRMEPYLGREREP